MRHLSFAARLNRIEAHQRSAARNVHLFIIDIGRQFETQWQLDEELKKQKYKQSTIIIDNRARMRKEMENMN